MKLRIYLKDENAVTDALNEVSFDETTVAVVSQWVKFGAFVTIEVDTDTRTCRVLTVDE
jgi:hypothetical protein